MSLLDKFKKNGDPGEGADTGRLETDATDDVAGDRGIASVNAKRRTPLMTRILQVILILFGVALLFASGYRLYKKYSAPVERTPAEKKKDEQIHDSAPLNFKSFQHDPEPALPASAPASVIPVKTASAATPASSANQGGAPARNDKAPPTPAERKLERGMAYDGSSDVSGENSKSGNAGAGTPHSNALGDRLNSTATAMATASVLPDLMYLVTKGTIVDCIAQSAVDTNQPGMLNCIGTQDVYSFDHKMILMERGTVYTIEYQQGLTQGQSRIFMLASRALTPHGIVVNLDSPMTDDLGRAGMDGKINTHFWTRFGGAIMIGLISDFGSALSNKMESSGSSFSVNNTTQGSTSAADKAIESTVNIPPTLEHNQGAHIKLYIARDLDFRSVYGISDEQPN